LIELRIRVDAQHYDQVVDRLLEVQSTEIDVIVIGPEASGIPDFCAACGKEHEGRCQESLA